MNPKDLFEILVREHTPALLAFLRTAVRDAAAVDDLYQDCLLTAWKRLSDYDRQRPFGAWLRGIAGHKLLAYYREKKQNEVALDEKTLLWLQDRFDRLQELPGDTWPDKLAALRNCLDQLPEHYRQPVTLRYFEQQSIEQMTHTLEMAAAALKKRLVRAKQRLAECLDRKLNQWEYAP